MCSNTFHILRPTKAPGFVYAWLELISHRIFIARMLAHTPQQKVCMEAQDYRRLVHSLTTSRFHLVDVDSFPPP